MNRPNWDSFNVVNSGDKQGAFEAMVRMLFKERYNLTDNLAYFKNHPGNETDTITHGGIVVGFQAKYFEGSIKKDDILDSIQKAHHYNPSQTLILIYTNSAFGANKGKAPKSKIEIEHEAVKFGITIEWWFGDNILDAVAKSPIIYDLFFNLDINIRNMHRDCSAWVKTYVQDVNCGINVNEKAYNVDRSEILSKIKLALNNQRDILLTGEGGTGKTALLKSLYIQEFTENNTSIYIINASQLDSRDANTLFQIGESYKLTDFCRFYNGCERKVFVIDAAEKLLTNSQQYTLSLLLNRLKELEWNIIVTCRKNAEEGVVKLLAGNDNLHIETITVPLLTKDELDSFLHKCAIEPPLDKHMYKRLSNLFYLARYCELDTDQCSQLTLSSFRNLVWNQKVRGTKWGADAQKREDCLIKIAVNQLQTNSCYSPKLNIDHDAAYALIQDEILVDNGIKGYSISHDIYADWAIDQYVECKFYDSHQDVNIFVQTIGESLSVINAIGRWLDAKRESQDVSVFKCLIQSMFEGKLSKKWQQALIKSLCGGEETTNLLFVCQKDKLLENNFLWLNNVIGLMNTSCKTIDGYFTLEGTKYPKIKPTGCGWLAAVILIDEIQDNYYMDNLKFVYIALNNYSLLGKNENVAKKAALLSLKLFDLMAQSRARGDWFDFADSKPWCTLVWGYSPYLKEELKERFKKVIENNWTKSGTPYYELSSSIVLSESTPLLLGLAYSNYEIITALLEAYWLAQNDKDDDISYWRQSGNSEWRFGLNKYMTYFPSSALQTPLYILLEAEQLSDNSSNYVLKFAIKFVNKIVDNYQKRHYEGDGLFKANIGLPDGSKKEIISSCCLWNLYRGTSSLSMPYLLESILMAVEKYLLDTLLNDFQANKERVRTLLRWILEESTSCATVAVVASVVSAYPELFYEEAKLLMTDIRLLQMDLMRCTKEIAAGSCDFAYHRHRIMGFERKASRELRHRKISLENLLINYQIDFGIRNADSQAQEESEKLYNIVENLKRQVEGIPQPERNLLDFMTARIDYRNMEKRCVEIAEGIQGIEYSPKLSQELVAEQDRFAKKTEDLTKGISLRYWVEKTYEGKEVGERNPQQLLDQIRDIEAQFRDNVNGKTLLVGDEFLPGMVCAILLIKYKSQLSDDQKKYCRDVLTDVLSDEEFLMSSPFSGFEIVINALPELMLLYPEDNQKWKQVIISYAEKRHETGNYRACDKVREMIGRCELWETHYEFMKDMVAEYWSMGTSVKHESTNAEVADTVFSLLPSGTDDQFIQQMAQYCMCGLATYWTDEYDCWGYTDNKFYVSYSIADYILRAKEDIRPLINPFVSYLNPNDSNGTLITSFLYTCCQYNLYSNFWKVWDIMYPYLVKPISFHSSPQELFNYLLVPHSINSLGNDWFRFEREDVAFFERVVDDLVQCPQVMFAISKVFSTIGRMFYKQSIPLFGKMIRSGIVLGENKPIVVFYMEKIVRMLFDEQPEQLKEDSKFREDIIRILSFMKENESVEAAQYMIESF